VTVTAARWSADGEKYRIGLVDAFRPGREREPLLRHVGGHEVGQARLDTSRRGSVRWPDVNET
jgi:hypothetical protein